MNSIVFQLLMNGFIAGSIYALIALSYNLIYKATKFSNLAHGGMLMVGSYVALCLTKNQLTNIWIASLIGMISAGFGGFSLEKTIFLPLRRNGTSKIVLFIASLGALMMIQAIIAAFFSNQSWNLLPVETNPATYRILGGIINQTQVLTMLIDIVSILMLTMLFKLTQFGKIVKAISDDEDVAKAIGINTEKYLGSVFFVASAVAGLAGILISLDAGMGPTMGFGYLFKGIIAAIIGGVNNFIGPVIGAMFLGFVENIGIWKLQGEWKDSIAFLVLILYLLLRRVRTIKK